ncbi:MAG TPA: histidine phosphatase family protein, partial [Dehalococcoidia bacterium]|nr:histidine phosphatase family protein [Dehalococcoidia bacterium]
ERLGRAVGLTPRPDARWQEYDIGHLAGLRIEEIRAQYPAIYEAMTRPARHYVPMPGEEGAWPFRHRITAAWRDLLTERPDGPIAVVTHRAVMMGLICHFVGFPPERRSPFRFSNGSISVLEAGPDRVRLGRLNDTCHLRGSGEECRVWG